MERKVSVSKKVNDTLENLVDILFDEDYFNYLEDAVNYVNNISDFIYNIPNKPYRVAPNDINGKFYITYKPNKHTTWYISFDVEDDLYFIRNITNNHSVDYPNFIANFS
jgi:hypothetical protein